MKKLLVGIFLVFTFLTQGWGATKTVCATGGNYTTIQAAINGVNAGDTISICNGTYNEALIVTKANLTIQSQSGNVADVTVTKDATVFTLESTNVTIKNLTINATKDNGIFGNNWQANSGHTFENLKITSENNGIELNHRK